MVSHVNVPLVPNYKLIPVALKDVLTSMNANPDNIIVVGCHAVISVLTGHPMVFKEMHGGMKITHNAFTGITSNYNGWNWFQHGYIQ